MNEVFTVGQVPTKRIFVDVVAPSEVTSVGTGNIYTELLEITELRLSNVVQTVTADSVTLTGVVASIPATVVSGFIDYGVSVFGVIPADINLSEIKVCGMFNAEGVLVAASPVPAGLGYITEGTEYVINMPLTLLDPQTIAV